MLTDKQEAFCKKIAEGMNQSDAYRAVYNTSRMKEKTVWENASELAGNPKVTARVKELRDMAAKPSIMTAQQRKEWLTKLINDPEVDNATKLKASDQLNRMEGEYTQRIEANVVNDVSINIELVDE